MGFNHGKSPAVTFPARPCYDGRVQTEIIMATVKQEALRILEQLSDNVSWEEIQYHLYVRQKIERARQQVQEGKVLTQDDVEARMTKWLDEK
jgi:hypothetical protein